MDAYNFIYIISELELRIDIFFLYNYYIRSCVRAITKKFHVRISEIKI
jgi:hypothetical protein